MKRTLLYLMMISPHLGCGDKNEEDSGTEFSAITSGAGGESEGETTGGSEDTGESTSDGTDGGSEDVGTENSATGGDPSDSGTGEDSSDSGGTTEGDGTTGSGSAVGGTAEDGGTADGGTTDDGDAVEGSEDTGSTSGVSDAVYGECETDADCREEMFCGIECWTGGCGPEGVVAEGTMGRFCQPCIECEFDSDAVSGSCESCGGSLYDDPSPDCSSADLYFRAEVRLPDGTVPPSFATTDAIVGAGIIENLCDRDLPYDTSTVCLVESATITSGAGGDVLWTETPACGDVVTEHTVPATDLTERSFPVGPLPSGDHKLTIQFGGAEVAVMRFSVGGG